MTTYTTADKNEAKAIAKALDNAVYYLAHGEYSRPEYTVRKVRNKNAYEIFAKYSYYVSTFNRKQNGAICEETAHYALS